MTNDQLYKQLTDIFHNLFDDNSIVLSSTTTAADVPGWDSFAHINLMLTVESEFGVKFRASDLEQMHSVGDIVGFIMHKRVQTSL